MRLNIYSYRPREFSKMNEIECIPMSSLLNGADRKQIEQLPELPDWVLEKPHMVCPPNSVIVNKLLGSGQYGNVYKGCYICGNARYKISFCTISINE